MTKPRVLISRCKAFIRSFILAAAKIIFKLLGRDWNDFYAWMLDFQDRRVTIDQILSKRNLSGRFKGLWDWERGEYYADYMSRHGLKPSDAVIDYGCGYGRVAIPLLKRQIEGGRYFGLEISARRLDLCRAWIAREGLEGRHAELVLSKDNAMTFVPDDTIDVIWALSVFNHMPDAELQQTLAAMARVLKPGGCLFAYYVVPEPGAPDTIKTFRRDDARMQELLDAAGLPSVLADDWDDDLGAQRATESRMRICRRAA